MDQVIAGARCAVHPDRPAQGTCKRCGNFACVECDVAGFDSGTLCVACGQAAAESRYHVVPAWRFLLLSLLSFNFYLVYWFWKNWTLVKRADGSDIWPIPRALFAGITYFSLIGDINTQLAARSVPRQLSTALGIGYLVVGLLYRLPDPYWLVSLLGCLFVLPAVNAITELASTAAVAKGATWSTRHTVLMLVLVPFFLLAVVGMLLPEDAVE